MLLAYARKIHPKRDLNGDEASFSNNGNYSWEPTSLNLLCHQLQIGTICIWSIVQNRTLRSGTLFLRFLTIFLTTM